MKKLTDFLNMLAESELRAGDNSDSADFDIPIKDITYNSLEAGEETLFICKGAGFKEEYLKDALAKGAAEFVCEMGSKVHEVCKADAELANQELADDLAGSGGRHQCGKHTAEYKGQEHSGHIVACGSHERPEQGCKKSVFRCEGNNNCAKDGAGDNTDALIAKDEEQNEGYDDGDAGYHNA